MTREQFTMLREELGIPKSKLAEFLGVERRTLGRWENGKSALPGYAGQLLTLAFVGMMAVRIHAESKCRAMDGCAACWVNLQLPERDHVTLDARRRDFRWLQLHPGDPAATPPAPRKRGRPRLPR